MLKKEDNNASTSNGNDVVSAVSVVGGYFLFVCVLFFPPAESAINKNLNNHLKPLFHLFNFIKR